MGRLGEGLVATAWAEPGDVIESIEMPRGQSGEGWVLGILWHTEEEASSNVMKAFCKAARVEVEA